MGPSRKRSSSKSSGVLSIAPKKEKLDNSAVTSGLAIPTGGWINDNGVCNVQCKTEPKESEEFERNGELENLVGSDPAKANTSIACGNDPGKFPKVKDEQVERDISKNPSEELKQSVGLNINESLQEGKQMQGGNGVSLNFTMEAGDKKKKAGDHNKKVCLCGRTYSCNSHLNRHRKVHGCEGPPLAVNNPKPVVKEKPKEQSFTCHCGKNYASKANMKRHQKNCSSDGQIEAVASPVTHCKVEDQDEKLKPYACACGKRYTCSSHLYRHQRSHLETKSPSERSYICDCGKSYSCTSHLYRHQKTHTEEKVLLGLQQQQKKEKEEVEEEEEATVDLESVARRMKPYMCFCGKSYTCSSHLYRHQKSHQGVTLPRKEKIVVGYTEKRYECKCGKRYSCNSHLNRHHKKHMDHKEQHDSLPEDNDNDNDSDHYSEGESEYSRQKPYRCECGKSFILSFSLLLHKKIHCRWKNSSSD